MGGPGRSTRAHLRQCGGCLWARVLAADEEDHVVLAQPLPLLADLGKGAQGRWGVSRG